MPFFHLDTWGGKSPMSPGTQPRWEFNYNNTVSVQIINIKSFPELQIPRSNQSNLLMWQLGFTDDVMDLARTKRGDGVEGVEGCIWHWREWRVIMRGAALHVKHRNSGSTDSSEWRRIWSQTEINSVIIATSRSRLESLYSYAFKQNCDEQFSDSYWTY